MNEQQASNIYCFNDGYLTKLGVRTFIGGGRPIGSSTLSRWVNQGDFPKPIYLTHRHPIWVKAEVVAWIESKRNK